MSIALWLRSGLAGLVMAGIFLTWVLITHYRDSYLQERARVYVTTQKLALANDTIARMQRRQSEIAKLDTRYTKELNDARLENDRLRSDVAAGRRQLHLKDTSDTSRISCTAPRSGLGDAAAVGLSRKTGSAVLDIRSEIIGDQEKLKFLQQYVRRQCQ